MCRFVFAWHCVGAHVYMQMCMYTSVHIWNDMIRLLESWKCQISCTHLCTPTCTHIFNRTINSTHMYLFNPHQPTTTHTHTARKHPWLVHDLSMWCATRARARTHAHTNTHACAHTHACTLARSHAHIYPNCMPLMVKTRTCDTTPFCMRDMTHLYVYRDSPSCRMTLVDFSREAPSQ